MNRRNTEITIETHNLKIIKTHGAARANFVRCRNCQTDVAVFRHAHAALIFRGAASEIKRLLQTEQIHCAAESVVCGVSLAAHFRQEIRYVKD